MWCGAGHISWPAVLLLSGLQGSEASPSRPAVHTTSDPTHTHTHTHHITSLLTCGKTSGKHCTIHRKFTEMGWQRAAHQLRNKFSLFKPADKNLQQSQDCSLKKKKKKKFHLSCWSTKCLKVSSEYTTWLSLLTILRKGGKPIWKEIWTSSKPRWARERCHSGTHRKHSIKMDLDSNTCFIPC